LRQAYTLDRIWQLMAFLGNPENNYKTIHIAGTSGKTSTAYYLTSFLDAAGRKVGLTVSPHIDGVNERVQINGQPLPEEQFCRYLETFLGHIKESNVKPTYFELLIAFAYWVFAKEKVEYAVIEVGLGGLLDGTNVINREDKVCVITDIGLDHTAILGKTLPEITSQKAGIIKPHNEVFMYRQDEAVMKVVREVCDQQQAGLHELEPPKSSDPVQTLPLFQQRNWFLASSVYSYLANRDGIAMNDEGLDRTIHTYIPARMEILEINHHTLILDGAHNDQKFAALTASIREKWPHKPLALLISMVQAKSSSLEASLENFKGLASHIIITSFATTQDLQKVSIDPLKIAEACDKAGFKEFEIINNPEAAYRALLNRPEGLIAITGSFYLLSYIRPLIKIKEEP
jgi:dihydrofolate synthase / folylpolyglutamate synthase